MAKEPRAEVEDELLARVELEEPAAEPLELLEQRDGDEEAGGGPEQRHRRGDEARRQQGLEIRRRRVRAEDAIDDDLQREREQQRERRGEEAQEEDGRQVGPVGPRVAQQPAADGEIAVARAARHDSPACRFTVESTAAIE